MSQHDLSIANQGFPAFRSDLNDALQALGSMQSGTTAPATTYANMLWYDTTNNIVKMRNEDNDAWISLFTLDQSGDLVSAISAATGTFGTLSATGNVTLGDSSSDTATVNAKTTFGSEISAPNTFGFKNRIINGAMMIDQRNAGASITASGVGGFVYTLDRWNYYASQASKFTVQQNAGSVTLPVGYGNYLGVTSTSAYSVTSGDLFSINQPIEGFNTSDLAWGTANAQTVTLSFWVRSSLTGAFGGAILNNASNRTYPFTYTVNSANTWEQKTITIAGDTTGTWVGATNSVGMRINFSLGTGSTYSGAAGSWSGSQYWSSTGATSVVGTSGATFYITGVQLEKGSTATSFDVRPYGSELALCQRYYQHLTASTSSGNYMPYGTGFSASTTYGFVQIPILVEMRSAPTLTNATVSQFRFGFTTCTALAVNSPSTKTVSLRADVASGLTSGQGMQLDSNNNQTSYIGLSAEL